jgi:uncharacterized protein with GYD domain
MSGRKENDMASYLIQVAYTPECWSALLKNPQDRFEAIRGPIEKLGGRLDRDRGWFSFGDYDVVAVLEMPNNVSAAALSLAFSAGGACRAVKTTPLLSVAEGLEAARQAASCGYKPATQTASAQG